MIKKLMTGALAGAALVGLTACTTSEELELVTYQADYPAYASVEEITLAADVVITGSVTGSETRLMYPERSDSTDPNENPFLGVSEEEWEAAREEGAVVTTVSTVLVESVLKGDVAVGDTIEVTQLGGTITETTDGRTETTVYDDPSTTILEDVPTDVVLLMLNDQGDSPYSTLNPLQAVYAVESDLTARPVTEDPSALRVGSIPELESVIEEG